MLPATFCHIKGLTPRAESKLWTTGILTWTQFLNSTTRLFSANKTATVRAQLEESRNALNLLDARYFTERLRPAWLPRLYPHFAAATAYLDIETTGLDAYAQITTIALYDGNRVFSFVRGKNMQEFPNIVSRFRLLVTYNGGRFDLPFLRREFGMTLDMAHIDLMRVLRALGYTGGLKTCENLMGLRRQVPEDMDGCQAVQLWHAYRAGDSAALKKLVAYNAQDVLSLEFLLIKSYNLGMRSYPLFRDLALPVQPRPGWPSSDFVS